MHQANLKPDTLTFSYKMTRVMRHTSAVVPRFVTGACQCHSVLIIRSEGQEHFSLTAETAPVDFNHAISIPGEATAAKPSVFFRSVVAEMIDRYAAADENKLACRKL